MKSIDNLVGDSIRDQTTDYIPEKDKKKFSREIRNSVAALSFLLSGFLYSLAFPEQDVIYSFIYLIGALVVAIPIFKTAVRGFLQKNMASAMEILVSIAVIVSILNNQCIIAILIPIILTLVHFFEEKSIMGGRDAIEGLKKMQSTTAILLKDGIEQEVDAVTLNQGDEIIVRPGMSLPIDGSILKGSSSMDQKSLTGESIPKNVEVGDKVFAGTINIEGAITVLVEKEYKDTSFQKIVKLLEGAENITLPETRIIDRFLVYYIPLALLVATFVWLLSQDISKAVAVLVVSCPCGLMLVSSAPMIASLAAATNRGILIKNSKFVEKLANVDCLVFDKTGTATRGILEAIGYSLDQALSYEELLTTAATVASGSMHPVSRSIVEISREVDFDRDYQVTEYVGKGLIGNKENMEIIVGNYKWLSSMGYEVNDKYDVDGCSSWVIKDKKVLGCLVFRDVPRDDAPKMICDLETLGINDTRLLTGDNEVSAERIRNAVGIKKMYCRLLPEQKLEMVKNIMKDKTVAFVGDGINDALALAEADVGIVMGAMGSDTAIQSADISLMNNNLDNISFAIRLARKTRRIIYQNIVIAFAVSFVMITLAAAGVIGALLGAVLHNLGAFVILINSGRIIKLK